MRRTSNATAPPPRLVVAATGCLTALIVLSGCSFPAADRVLAEGQDWQLAVVAGPELRFQDGGATSGASDYSRPASLEEASTFRTDDGTTLFAGPVSDDAAKVTVATRDGGESQGALVESHGGTWFWVQVPGEQEAAGFVALDESGTVIDEYALPAMPLAPETILVEPKPL